MSTSVSWVLFEFEGALVGSVTRWGRKIPIFVCGLACDVAGMGGRLDLDAIRRGLS